MTDRSHARMVVLAALVMSLVVTLAARSFSLQVLGGGTAAAAARDNRDRELVIPAPRGMILDQQGRPLATNRIALDVVVARRELRQQPDDGRPMLDRLAGTLQVPAATLAARLQNCGTAGARPQPDCWNGAPGADPVVARDVPMERAAPILADRSSYPGVSVVESAVRQYPGGQVAAHALGYVGAITADDLAADPGLAGVPGRGRAGLEAQYDEALRGRPGLERVQVDSTGHPVAAGVVRPAEPGQTLVSTIDADLQRVVEKQLAAAMKLARTRFDRVTGRLFRGDGAAGVVLDVRTGAVLALASAPTFDANVWTGGISARDYAALTDPGAGRPLLDRSLQAALAPASTFKVVTTAAALTGGYSGSQLLPCPSAYRAGGRLFSNYRSRAHGYLTLAQSLAVSCDTAYYQIADEYWRADGGSRPADDPADAVSTMAASFGFGSRTGIDLPGEAPGQLASRQAKAAAWAEHKDDWCRRAQGGYPEISDKERSRYLRALARENCDEGMRWRVGDALNAAIGQGDTAATVLQVAVAYAAIANGGTVWTPRIAKALLHPDGSVAREFAPNPRGRVDVPAEDLAYLRQALRGVIENGTARRAFEGFPVGQVPLAGKTGTGEVYGSQVTSWFASFAPADEPRYAVVMMVSQGGTGAGTAGRSVKGIHEALFGVRDGVANPARSVLHGGDVAPGLPRIDAGGLPVPPATSVPAAATPERAAATPEGAPATAAPAPATPEPAPATAAPAPAGPVPAPTMPAPAASPVGGATVP